MYCAVVLDAYSRGVTGWSIDSSPTAVLVTNALGMAIDSRIPPAGAIIHSDQGPRSASRAITQRAEDSGIVPATGGVADRHDAMMESFRSRTRVERHRRRLRVELTNATFEHLETWQNRRRRHNGIGMLIPRGVRKHPRSWREIQKRDSIDPGADHTGTIGKSCARAGIRASSTITTGHHPRAVDDGTVLARQGRQLRVRLSGER